MLKWVTTGKKKDDKKEDDKNGEGKKANETPTNVEPSPGSDPDVSSDEGDAQRLKPPTLKQIKEGCDYARKAVSFFRSDTLVAKQMAEGMVSGIDKGLPIKAEAFEQLRKSLDLLKDHWYFFVKSGNGKFLDDGDTKGVGNILWHIWMWYDDFFNSDTDNKSSKDKLSDLVGRLRLLWVEIINCAKSSWAFVLMADQEWFNEYWGSPTMPIPDMSPGDIRFDRESASIWPKDVYPDGRPDYVCPAWRYHTQYMDDKNNLPDQCTDVDRPIYITSGDSNPNFDLTRDANGLGTLLFDHEDRERRHTLLQLLSGCQQARVSMWAISRTVISAQDRRDQLEPITLAHSTDIHTLAVEIHTIGKHWKDFKEKGNGWMLDTKTLDMFEDLLVQAGILWGEVQRLNNGRFSVGGHSEVTEVRARMEMLFEDVFKRLADMSEEIRVSLTTHWSPLLLADQPWFDDFWGSVEIDIPKPKGKHSPIHAIYPRPDVDAWPHGKLETLVPPYKVYTETPPDIPAAAAPYTKPDVFISLTPLGDLVDKNFVYHEDPNTGRNCVLNPIRLPIPDDSGTVEDESVYVASPGGGADESTEAGPLSTSDDSALKDNSLMLVLKSVSGRKTIPISRKIRPPEAPPMVYRQPEPGHDIPPPAYQARPRPPPKQLKTPAGVKTSVSKAASSARKLLGEFNQPSPLTSKLSQLLPEETVSDAGASQSKEPPKEKTIEELEEETKELQRAQLNIMLERMENLKATSEILQRKIRCQRIQEELNDCTTSFDWGDDVKPSTSTPRIPGKKKKKKQEDVVRSEDIPGYIGNMSIDDQISFIDNIVDADSTDTDKGAKKKKAKKEEGAQTCRGCWWPVCSVVYYKI